MTSIDLRSDTVTQPTPAMRKAMSEALVGDDVFEEDPTVVRLEEMAAELMGKDKALFVASGTMANLVSLLTHCGRGSEIILGDQSHIFFYEQGGCAALGGIQARTVKNRSDGSMDLCEIESAVRGDNIHFPRTRLIALENTHNRCNGSPVDVDHIQAVGAIAMQYGLKLHMDGARIFNASIALGIPARNLVKPADSVSFCLSKGLAAPVGSLICGNREFIAEARRNRKLVGGGMRQAGVLAAAGIVALNEMVGRLGEDHRHAFQLAQGISGINGFRIDLRVVKTNIVYFELGPDELQADEFSRRASMHGIRVMPLGPRRLRAVTHYQISSEDIDRTLTVFKTILKQDRAY